MVSKTCNQCPRLCGVDRTAGKTGYCGVPHEFVVARCAPHLWEEPPVSGTRGSGTVFFAGCNLRCVFCQNHTISHTPSGKTLTYNELCERLLSLQDEGVHNLNFVTPTHYTESLIDVLTDLRPKLRVPVVWNSGGYESVDVLRRLDGLVDVYLPDFKYVASDLSSKYSGATDYADRATEALSEMYRQTGKACFDDDGLIRRGVIVRHLVLPGCREDSIRVLHRIAEVVPVSNIRLSLMSQYTPEFAKDCPYGNLHRRVTSFEYNAVLREAEALGFEGYCQDRSSATDAFTPTFRS